MIDKKTIQRIAQLARLQVNENEADQYAVQLTKVLNHFQEISDIDTTNIAPMITPTEITLNLREDIAKHEFTTEDLLKNAPDKMGQLFKVPPVI
jgi:aspartyl-tRNA(Asn)/glutamyl-tRNA(Gln) amidotransferase subunit C